MSDGSEFPSHRVEVRRTRARDFAALRDISRRVYPDEYPWTEAYLQSHLRHFPDGQLVATLRPSGRVLGMAASLIVDWRDYETGDSYGDFTGGGWFTNHDPTGTTLYGAEVMVDPSAQGMGAGKALYAARRDLCRRLGLERIRAGARIPGYAEVSHRMSAEEYVLACVRGERVDPTLTFQLAQGFHVVSVVRGYARGDRESDGYGVLIEWDSDALVPGSRGGGRDPRTGRARGRRPSSGEGDRRGA